MVEIQSERSKLLSAVFNNVPELVAYYPRITALVPYTDDTRLWVIGRPGSTKTTIALALADRLDNDLEIKGKKPKIWFVDFDRHLAFMEDETGWSRRKPEHAGLLLPLTAYSVLTSLWWIKKYSDKPSISVIDLPVIPHRRDNGRNIMHKAIYDTRDETGQINRIIPIRPNKDLLEQILAGRKERDKKQLYSRNTASADVTVKAYLNEFDLIDELIEKEELPKYLKGFREDPKKADEALEGVHILECRKALGVTRIQHKMNSEEFYRTVRIAPLPPDIATQINDTLLEQWVHEYPLPLDQIIKELTGPHNIKAFVRAIRKVSPEQRIHFPIPEPLTRTEIERLTEKKKSSPWKADYMESEEAHAVITFGSKILGFAFMNYKGENRVELNWAEITSKPHYRSGTIDLTNYEDSALDTLENEGLIEYNKKQQVIIVKDIYNLQQYLDRKP